MLALIWLALNEWYLSCFDSHVLNLATRQQSRLSCFDSLVLALNEWYETRHLIWLHSYSTSIRH
jgi:hypothetical protein